MTTSAAIEMAGLDAVAQAELVRRGEVTAAELVGWAIERIEDLNPILNAVITPMYEQALAAAAMAPSTGRLAGVPYLVKDLIAEVAGVPFSEGSRFLRGHVSHVRLRAGPPAAACGTGHRGQDEHPGVRDGADV